MKQEVKKRKPYVFKKIKTYSAEEILASGGTTEFGEKTGYDAQAIFRLQGKVLSEEDYQKALSKIVK